MKKGVLIGVAVVAAAGLGFLLQRHLHGDAAATAPASTPVTASATAGDADAGDQASGATPAAAKIPDTLPGFELADRDGRKRKLADWSGRPLMVNFWATWCAPCRREIPLLNQVRDQRKAQKLEIIGIAVDFRDDVLKYATDTHIGYPLLIGEEDGLAAVSSFGMEPNFPFTVFADSKQRLVAVKIGELHQEDIDLILDRVAEVDAGKLELPAAREQISEGLKQIAAQRASKQAAQAANSPKLPAI